MNSKVLQITWLGHSCFVLEAENYSIVTDPYTPDSVPGLEPIQIAANDVYCSHDHHDHNGDSYVTRRKSAPCPFTVRTVTGCHDHHNGQHRGPNTIRIFQYKDLEIVHLGDQGCPLTPAQIAEIGTPDVLLIPIGGYYTIDAKEAYDMIQQLKPRIAIPMHYRGEDFGYPEIETLAPFEKLCSDITYYFDNKLRITKDTPSQIAVLSYRR